MWESDNHVCYRHIYSGNEPSAWSSNFDESTLGKAYTVLIHKPSFLLVMSDTEVEHRSNQQILSEAKGDVLMFGLGINFINDRVLALPQVRSVTIVEKYTDIIANTPTRCRVVQADVLTDDLRRLGKFDYIWNDIEPIETRDFDYLLNPTGVYRIWNQRYGLRVVAHAP